ncbi:hypothetical protein SAMN05444050_0697 [Afipia sp. GAS231]|nr:hypothetical protein SAMN05444050_0697 [Afipia sp. GAS231]
MSQFSDLVAFFEDSGVAEAIRENDTLFPLIESVHVVAISLVVGSILALDLRLLGFASVGRPVSRFANAILPVTWASFAIAATTGFLLFISNASKYLSNGYFDAKIILICAAGLNMIVFHVISAKDMPQWEKLAQPPFPARAAGAISILLWIAVVVCGRWIGFTMQGL